MPISKEELYNSKHTYDKAIERLERSGISECNKKHIYRFLEYCRAQNVGTLRQCFYIEKLRTIGCIVKKDFRQLNKEDMVSLLSGIVEKGFSEGTIDSYHIAIIRFFRWLNGCEKGDVNLAILRVIKRKRPTNKLEQEDLISADDVKKIISCCVLHCKCNSI